ncbi:MAG TPA: sulfite exporter TauE/SafE family protein [Dehalococcoidia bacterium]|nr:sulfite exporter TauE/SafE family protein [Dehalococcoidia bacterium]
MSAGLLLLIPLGFAVGAFGTMIGAGGGFILVPALLLLFPDYGPERVTAISLGVVWANATSGSIAYARQGRIDYVTGLLFAAASVPGVIGGAVVVHSVPERAFSALFAALLLVLAAVTLRPARPPIQQPRPARGLLVRTVVTRDGVTYRYAYPAWQGIALSAGIGFASSLFGIGGGVIHVPAMIVLFRIPVQFAVATSHFILAFMAGGATIVHLVDGSLRGERLAQAAALAAGAVPGAQFGAWLAHRTHSRIIVAALAVALVALAGRLFAHSLGF